MGKIGVSNFTKVLKVKIIQIGNDKTFYSYLVKLIIQKLSVFLVTHKNVDKIRVECFVITYLDNFDKLISFYGRCPEGIGRHKVKISVLLSFYPSVMSHFLGL